MGSIRSLSPRLVKDGDPLLGEEPEEDEEAACGQKERRKNQKASPNVFIQCQSQPQKCLMVTQRAAKGEEAFEEEGSSMGVSESRTNKLLWIHMSVSSDLTYSRERDRKRDRN